MAWASKKQFAILNGSKEGKDIIERLPKLKQDEFQKVFDNYLNKPKGANRRMRSGSGESCCEAGASGRGEAVHRKACRERRAGEVT
jgi:hypothetical protein